MTKQIFDATNDNTDRDEVARNYAWMCQNRSKGSFMEETERDIKESFKRAAKIYAIVGIGMIVGLSVLIFFITK